MRSGDTSVSPPTDSAFASRTYRWEGFVFNAVCAIYFLWLAPVVVEASNAAMRDPEARVIWLGVLLIAISLAEIWAFPVKMRFVNEAIRDQGDAAGRAFYLWMFHAVISVILVFLIAGAFGVKIGEHGEEELPSWMAVLLPIVVIKELVFLGFLFGGPGSGSGEETPSNPKYARPQAREWIADAILVVYACVVYSATWSTITTGLDLERENPPMFVLNLLVSTLLFLIFYLPLRIPYWIEELAQVKTWRDRVRLSVSVLLVLAPALGLLG